MGGRGRQAAGYAHVEFFPVLTIVILWYKLSVPAGKKVPPKALNSMGLWSHVAAAKRGKKEGRKEGSINYALFLLGSQRPYHPQPFQSLR